jgi:2-methylisocitrate lyase-like PEP mutase family enzyme
MMPKATTQLRRVLRARTFLELPEFYDPFAARIAERAAVEKEHSRKGPK